MPVVVVGADTSLGAATLEALLPRNGEVRAFVTSPAVAAELRGRGVKVALGDVSDGSHVGGAALNAFCAVLVGEAASDDRERSFAADPDAVLEAWIEGLNDAKVSRAIVVWDQAPPELVAQLAAETVVVTTAGRSPNEVAAEVADLEEVAELP